MLFDQNHLHYYLIPSLFHQIFSSKVLCSRLFFLKVELLAWVWVGIYLEPRQPSGDYTTQKYGSTFLQQPLTVLPSAPGVGWGLCRLVATTAVSSWLQQPCPVQKMFPSILPHPPTLQWFLNLLLSSSPSLAGGDIDVLLRAECCTDSVCQLLTL